MPIPMFFQVVTGMEVVMKMQQVPANDEDIPRHPIVIRDCGELSSSDIF